MVGVPGDAISNTTPPKITLLGLGALQTGLLLALQARRVAGSRGPGRGPPPC